MGAINGRVIYIPIFGDITTAISEAQKVAQKANIEIDIIFSDNSVMRVRPDSNILDLLEIYDLRVKLNKKENAV